VAAPPSPQTKAQAAASLVEAGTSGDGQEELGPSGDKKKRSRKRKDPAAPKKALTAYLVFINGKRDQVVKEHPEADLKDQVGLQLEKRRKCYICRRQFNGKPSIIPGCPCGAFTTDVCFPPSAYLFGEWCEESNHLCTGQAAASAQLCALTIHSLHGQQSHVSMSKYCLHGAGAAVSCALAADQSS